MADANSNIPKSLIDALKAGEVVPFVGAGVSLAVKKKNKDGTKSEESLFPSWKGYVEILAQTLIEEGKPDEANLVEAYIKSAKPKYLEAMQHAFEELPKEVWFRKLNEYFKKDEIEAAPDSLELPKLVWELGSNVIFTTNIDRVLEWKSVKEPPVETLDAQKVETAELQADKNPLPTLFYLHGRVGDKDNIVFTREQYDDFYKNNENEAKLRTLQAFLTTKSFLFIGFSLDDAYFVEELKNIHKIYKGGAKQYYALIKQSDAGRLKDFDFVTEVYFEDFDEPLLKIMREMRDIAREANSGNIIPPKSEIPKSDKDKPFFNVPYNSKGGEFVGRKGKMEEIRSLLGQDGCASIGQAVSVKGFGGLGKTQLAVEYAHEYRNEYKNGVFWLVADENIDNQLLQIADRQGWINQYDKTVNQLDVAKAKFLELSECLIIFDNVESQDDIKDYLPKPDSRTHILITSRYKQSSFRQVDLELLERDESRELLLKISNRNSPEEAEKEHLENILETLGDIPLAIELVGGYLAEHENVTFAKYHQFLDEVPLDKLEKEFPEGSFTNHDRSIIQTLRISEKTIKEKPLMVEILKVLAWSGSSSMGISLLQTLVEVESDFEFETALGDAYKLRLLKQDEDAERYAIHRLLAKVIRYETTLEENKQWYEKIASRLEGWFYARNHNFNFLTECESELEHLQEWLNQIFEIYPSVAVNLLILKADFTKQRGNYYEAHKWIDEALDLYNKAKVDDEFLLSTVYNNLGAVYADKDDFNTSLYYNLECLKIRKTISNEDHIAVALSLLNVGTSYSYLEKYEEALIYMLEALDIYRKEFDEKHPYLATCLDNIGATHVKLHNLKEGLDFQLQGLEIRQKIFGNLHPDLAISFNNISATYEKFYKKERAIEYKKLAVEYLEDAVKINQETIGTQHPVTFITYKNLIVVLLNSGFSEKAKKKACEFLNYFPQNHPDRVYFEKICKPYKKNKHRHNKRRR